ncbi:hypothetical protein JCM3765_002487 [Sporobolomyces pararoseus]
MDPALESCDTGQQQAHLDQLVESISSRDFNQFNNLLTHLNPEWIDKPHSTSKFSPLETLFTRYPQINSIDLEILKALFEKGSDLGKVRNEELSRMMEVEEGDEEEESNSVKEEFEKVLIEKFAELDRLKEEELNNKVELEPEAIKLEEEEEATSFHTSPPSDTYSIVPLPHKPVPPVAPRNPISSPKRRNSNTSIHPHSALPYPPRRQITSNTFLPLPPSRPIPPPSGPTIPTPSNLIRLRFTLPSLTTKESIFSYFNESLGIEISNLVIRLDSNPAHGYFNAEKRIYENGELFKKVWKLENEKNFFRDLNGRIWKLNFRVASVGGGGRGNEGLGGGSRGGGRGERGRIRDLSRDYNERDDRNDSSPRHYANSRNLRREREWNGGRGEYEDNDRFSKNQYHSSSEFSSYSSRHYRHRSRSRSNSPHRRRREPRSSHHRKPHHHHHHVDFHSRRRRLSRSPSFENQSQESSPRRTHHHHDHHSDSSRRSESSRRGGY